MITSEKPMTIKTACRLLRCANRQQLANRLGTTHQTIQYWHKRCEGRIPGLWRDRVELLHLKAQAAKAAQQAPAPAPEAEPM